MSTTVNRSLAALAAGAIAVTGLTGCSSDPAVKKGDVAKQITTKVSATGMKVKDMKCDDDLKAKVDATTKCEGEVNGTKQKFVAKVTSVNGKTVNYTISKG